MILLATISMLLSLGFVNYNSTMIINDDKSVTYTESIELDKNSREYNELNVLDNEVAKRYKASGIVVKEDNNKYIFTKTYDSINDLSSEVDVSCDISLIDNKIDNQYCFKKEKGFFFNTYYAKISNKAYKDFIHYTPDDKENDLIINNIDDDTTVEYSFDSYKRTTKAHYVVQLPYPIISTNADKKDNNTLSWDLINNKPKSDYFEYSFKVPNLINIFIGIGVLGLVVFLIIAVIISFIINKPKKENINQGNTYNRKEEIEELDQLPDNNKINDLLKPEGEVTEDKTPIPEEENEPINDIKWYE